MAFKTLFSIVPIVAAIQGASGELVAVLSLIHGTILICVCSGSHSPRCMPRWQEHRDERSLLRPIPHSGRHHREPLPQPVRGGGSRVASSDLPRRCCVLALSPGARRVRGWRSRRLHRPLLRGGDQLPCKPWYGRDRRAPEADHCPSQHLDC